MNLMTDLNAETAGAATLGAGRSIDRIVVINDFASASGGGASVITLQAIREYRNRGLAVTLITGETATPEIEAMGVDTIGLGSKRLLDLPAMTALRQGLHNAKAAETLSNWIAANNTPGTVYHLHNWSQILSPSVFGALRRVEARLVVTCHDFFLVCPNGGFVHYGQSQPCPLRPMSPACLASRCDRRNGLHKAWRIGRQAWLGHLGHFAESNATFTFIHERMRQRFIAAGFAAHDLVTLPNPVQPWSDKRIEAERNHSFLFVGRLGPDKGSDLAIEAAQLAGQPITLIGDGPREYPALGDDKLVTFAGWCDREAVVRHARQARALVVPSRVTEPFGLVILEAAASGLPVIVSDRAYLADDVVNGGFGSAVAVTSPQPLAQAIADLASDDEMAAMQSRAGHARARDLCVSPQAWSGEFIALFERKLAAAGQ